MGPIGHNSPVLPLPFGTPDRTIPDRTIAANPTAMDSTETPPSSPSAAGLSPIRFRDRRGHPHSPKKKKKPSLSSAPKSTHDCCRRRDRGGGASPSVPPPPPASFSDLPFDVLARLAAPFDVPNLWAASMVCRAWRESLRPLRQAMVLLRWGKRFRHGHGGVRPNPQRALEYFLKGTALGSAPAMVDAGVMYWEMGEREKAMDLYEKAADLGHPVGQSNLGTCYLEANLPEKAVKWFRQAAESDYARAQYNLALCLHRGRGVDCNLQDAAKWYLKAAEGGNVRAMYNTSLCYSLGEGKPRNIARSRMWLKRAADCGHKKAQFEHGLELFNSGNMIKAVMYFELATRAGETAASNMRDLLLQSLSQTARNHAMLAVDKWRPLKFNH